MTTEQEIKKMKLQISDLLKWKEEREKQQLTLPIDYQSMKALDNAFREFKFTEISVTSIYLQPVTNIVRNKKGLIAYYDDLGTQNFICTTTVNPPDASDFTGRINLTAV